MKKIMQDQKERRKNKRFEVQQGVFAVLGNTSGRMGQIIDISQGGLAFHHRNSEKNTEEVVELSILFDDEGNTSGYGPLKFQAVIVEEIPLKSSGNGMASLHRCCLKFKDLTYYQRSWLNDCIQNLTIVEVAADSKNVVQLDTFRKETTID